MADVATPPPANSASAPGHDPEATPIDRYLDAQADLRIVDRFARTDVEGRTGRWSDLIPLSAPTAGEQYRFEVDLDQCTGCKACVAACHSLNGLDEGESFRSIGLLVATAAAESETASATTLTRAEQHVTTACHHCADPGCLNGCPAEAYEKDPVTGVVSHIDDACIGCQYCTLTCPYDVPVYNERLGIVRKCDLCTDRLADGEAPACVQGCPTSAISVSTVRTDGAVRSPDRLLPGAAPSALTSPTTRYRGSVLQGGSRPGGASVPSPQHAHGPLVVMLVLSQLSVGVLMGHGALAAAGESPGSWVGPLVAGLLVAASATASFAHLGQPLKAWRAVLGWSHSWLSREVIAIGVYLGAVGLAVTLAALDHAAADGVAIAAIALGLAAVVCSTMIYVVTGRTYWSLPRTAARFGGSVAIGVGLWMSAAALGDGGAWPAIVGVAVVVAGLAVKRPAMVARGEDAGIARSALLLDGPLAGVLRLRSFLVGAGVAGLLIATLFGGDGPLSVAAVGLGVAAILASELLERRMYFTACAPETMPGTHR